MLGCVSRASRRVSVREGGGPTAGILGTAETACARTKGRRSARSIGPQKHAGPLVSSKDLRGAMIRWRGFPFASERVAARSWRPPC